jgi:hypothetical protein
MCHVWQTGCESVALNVLPKTLYRTKIFECFELKFLPLSTYCFRKKTSSPLRKRGKLEFIRSTNNRRISMVTIFPAYETLCDEAC